MEKQQVTDPKKKALSFYESLKTANISVPDDFEQFYSVLSDSTRATELHEKLSPHVNLPDVDTFISSFSKKKDGTQPSGETGTEEPFDINVELEKYGQASENLRTKEARIQELEKELGEYDTTIAQSQEDIDKYNESVKNYNTLLNSFKEDIKVADELGGRIKEFDKQEQAKERDKLDRFLDYMDYGPREIQDLLTDLNQEALKSDFAPREGQSLIDETGPFKSILDVPADAISEFVTGKPVDDYIKSDSEKTIFDRTFGGFGKQFVNTMAFELPSAAKATASNIVGGFKDKLSKDLVFKAFKAITPKGGKAVTDKVTDVQVDLFDWAMDHKNAKALWVPGPGGAMQPLFQEKDLIKSMSQIKKPLDVLDFVSVALGQGIAQIPLSVATKGTSSYIQEVGNTYLDGVAAIAEEKGISTEEVIRQGLDEQDIARLYGVIAGGMDAIGAKGVWSGISKKAFAKDLRSRGKEFFKKIPAVPKAMATEFVTEGSQSVTTQVGVEQMKTADEPDNINKYFPPTLKGEPIPDSFKKVDWSQALDEALAGLIASGGISSVGASANAIAKNRKAKKEALKTAEARKEVVEELKKVVEKHNPEVAKDENIDEYINEAIDNFIKDDVDPKDPPAPPPVAPVEEVVEEEVVEEEVVEDAKPPIPPVEPVEKKEAKGAAKVVQTPVAQIDTDVDRFQNRDEDFSEESVNSLIEAITEGRFDVGKMDAVKTWVDPKDGKTYVLAGHSRREAFKRAQKMLEEGKLSPEVVEDLKKQGIDDFTTIPSQDVSHLTEEEAIAFATEESNTLATQETELAGAVLWQKLRADGLSEAAIKKRMKGRPNIARLSNLSNLKKGGKTWSAVKALEKSEGIENKQRILQIGEFIGNARKLFPNLTDAHENELYTYLSEGKGQKLTTRAQFIERLGNVINNIAFQEDPTQPLNLENRVTRGANESEQIALRNEINNEIKALEKERVGNPSESRMVQIGQEISALQKRLLTVLEDINKARVGDRAQVDLFGTAPVKKTEIDPKKRQKIKSDIEVAENKDTKPQSKEENPNNKHSLEAAQELSAELESGKKPPSKKKEGHTYLMTQRPPSIGTHPDGMMNDAVRLDLPGRPVWRITYKDPLSQEQVDRFELTRELTSEDVGSVWSHPLQSAVYVITSVNGNSVEAEMFFGPKHKTRNFTQRGFSVQLREFTEVTSKPKTDKKVDLPEVGKSKIHDRPDMENPVHVVNVNGKPVYIQRQEGDYDSWVEVSLDKDGYWEVSGRNNENFDGKLLGFTKAEAIESLMKSAKEAEPLASKPKKKKGKKKESPKKPTMEEKVAEPVKHETSKSRTPIGDFEKRKGEYEKRAIKLYEEIIRIHKKYNPDGKLGEQYKAKGSLGTYFPSSKGVRLTGLNDITVAVHELTHALDFIDATTKRLIFNTEKGDPMRGLLTDIYEEYYPGGSRKHSLDLRMTEGYAVLLQHYIENPTVIKAKYPELVAEFLEPGGEYYNSTVGEYLSDLDKLVGEYQVMSAIDKMGATMTNDPELIEDDHSAAGEKTTYDKLSEEVVNALYPIEKMMIESGKYMTDEDITLDMRLANQAQQIATANFTSKDGYRTMDDKGEWNLTLPYNWAHLNQKLEKEGNTSAFGAFLIGRRLNEEYKALNKLLAIQEEIKNGEFAARLMENDAELDQETAQEIADQYLVKVEDDIAYISKILDNEQKTESEVAQAFEEGKDLFKEETEMFDALTQADLDLMNNPLVMLLDNAGHSKMSTREGYAPFKRIQYDELYGSPEGVGVKQAGANEVSSLKRRKGGTGTVLNPLMGGMMNHAEAVRKATKQMVYNKVLGLAKDHPDVFHLPGLQTTDDPKNRFPQKTDPKIIMAKKNYKWVPILVNDEMFKRAIDENFDIHNMHAFDEINIRISQMFRAGTTGKFIQFIVNNVLMDQVTAYINSRNGYFPGASILRHTVPAGLNIASKKLSETELAKKLLPSKYLNRAFLFPNSVEAKYLKEYTFGAGTSQTFLSAEIQSKRDIEKTIKESKANPKNQTMPQKAWQYVKNIPEYLSVPGNISEVATRGAEYIMARKAGKSFKVALEEAGQVSAPFHHIGRWHFRKEKKTTGRGQDRVRSVPYFGASIQVLAQTKKSLETNPGAKKRMAITALSMMATSAAALAYILDEDEDDIQRQILVSQPPDMLTRYLWLPNPFSDERLLKIRIPETAGVFVGLMNMAMIDHAKANIPFSPKEYGQAATSFLPRQVNPFGGIQTLLSWMPHAPKTAAESALGIKTFPNIRDIENRSDLTNPVELRFNKYSSPMAKWLSENGAAEHMGWSPKEIDHFVEGFFGRAIKYVTGKPGSYGFDSQFQQTLNIESSRQFQWFWDQKKDNEIQVTAHYNDTKILPKKEIDHQEAKLDIITDIEVALLDFQELEIGPKNDREMARLTREMFRLMKQLEKLNRNHK